MEGEAGQRSVERAAANEATFRKANEELDRARGELRLDGATPFLCECEEEGCTTLLFLTGTEYSEARAKRNRFVLAPGHPYTMGTTVLSDSRYILVEKHGKAGEIAEEEAR